MARTAEGRRLTEQHKRAQIKLGAIAAALTLENAKTLDPDDLDGTRGPWEARQSAIIATMRAQAQRMAEDYLRAFWSAEGMKPREIMRPELPDPRESVAWVVPTIKARTARYGNEGG